MNIDELKAAVASGAMTLEEAIEIGTAQPQQLKLKVSDKGALSIYGLMNKFPVTLYPNQWERIFSEMDRIREFIRANDGKFSVK